MNQDAALDKWLEAELPVASFNTRLAVCAAWHAAVKHTLEHVAGELNSRAEKQYSTGTVNVRSYLRKLAGLVLKMKP